MNASSIARLSSGQPSRPGGAVAAAPVREYRRSRQHLYPLDAFQAALTHGGTIRTYCGLETTFKRGNPDDAAEVVQPAADDCVTCVDVWRGARWVRL